MCLPGRRAPDAASVSAAKRNLPQTPGVIVRGAGGPEAKRPLLQRSG